MKNFIIYCIIATLLLYALRIPVVVSFVDGLYTVFATVYNYLLDVLIHLRERHPYIYILLPMIAFILMIPEKDT